MDYLQLPLRMLARIKGQSMQTNVAQIATKQGQFSSSNSMDSGIVSSELKSISPQELLIVKIHAVSSVHKIERGQQLGYPGNVVPLNARFLRVCKSASP